MAQTEVLVVGAGLAGLSAAVDLQATRGGVVVVDKEEAMAAGWAAGAWGTAP